MCWTRLEAAPQAFADLPDEERQGLLSWLAHVAGPTARVVGALLDRGRADRALPLGLVCAALWADEQPDTVRRRGRVDQYLDAPGLDDDVLRAFGQHSVTTVRDILREVGGPDASAARELCRTILDEADDLLVSFGATTAASRSGILRSGFAHRRDVAAEAMRTAISSVRRGGATTALAEAAAAVADLAEHDLARHDLGESHRRTAHRAQMAMRLLRWLDSPLRVQDHLSSLVDRHVNEISYVDMALDQVGRGSHRKCAGRRLPGDLRSGFDPPPGRGPHLRARAGRMDPGRSRRSTHRGDSAASVVAPLVRAGSDDARPVLFIVVDGMTAAIAAQLATEVTAHGWVEV